jgi:hypothetical protein
VEESGGQKQADIASQLLSSNSCLAALAREGEEKGETKYLQSKAIISAWTSGSGAQSLKSCCKLQSCEGWLYSRTAELNTCMKATAEQVLTSLFLC